MDQFVSAYRDAVVENYANFGGRLGLGGFWRFVAVNVVISVVLNILARASGIFFVLVVIYSLALLVPGIAAGVRRMHDIGKPGVWVLLGLIPCVGFFVLIYFFAQPGQTGPNEYGPQPAT